MKRKKKFDKLSDAEFQSMKKHISQEMKCDCGRWVYGVDINAVSVKCPICTCLMVPLETKLIQQKSGFPRGWKMYGEFVHEDGRVFRKGVEIPELRGKLPPTDMNKIKEKALANKKNKKAKLEKREAKLVKIFEKKKLLKKKDKINKKQKLQELVNE